MKLINKISINVQTHLDILCCVVGIKKMFCRRLYCGARRVVLVTFFGTLLVQLCTVDELLKLK